MPAGRPSLNTPEIRAKIISGLADGETLTAICLADEMPGRQTVLDWQHNDPDFRAQCVRARKSGAEAYEQRMIALLDSVESGAIEPDAARVIANGITWLAKIRDPATYGDAPASVNVAVGVNVATATVADRAEHVRAKLARKGLLPAPAQHTESEQQQGG